MTVRPLTRLTQLLLRLLGKSYVVDPRVPDALLAREMLSRAGQLVRGLLRFRSLVFVQQGVSVRGRRMLSLERGVTLGAHSRLDAFGVRGVSLGPRSKLGAYSLITTTSHLSRFGEGLRIGRDTGIGEFAHLGCSGGVVIGDDVIAGPFLTIHSQEHVATDPSTPIRLQGTIEDEVVIEDDVWIGARVTILAGTTIGRGSVIGAGAVVKGQFPSYSLIAGVPAKRIRTIRASEARPD